MKQRIIYGLLAGLFMGLYWLTWGGAMLFVFIIAACLFAYLISAWFHRGSGFLGIIGIVVAGAVVALTFIYKILPGAFSGMTAIATMELESLTLPVAWWSFGFIIFLVPVALGLLFYQVIKRGGTPSILLLVWSLIMLVAMIEYLRFAYYFAVNASLLTAWFVWYAWQRLKEKSVAFAVLTTALLLVIMIIPNAQHAVATAKRSPLVPPDAWCETLEWVKENTPEDSVILSWWDYGYWINRMADREAYCDPAQSPEPIKDTARMFLSLSEGEVEADYIILDYSTVTGKFWAVAVWADLPVEEFYSGTGLLRHSLIYYPRYYQSLAVRLYNFNGKAVIPDDDDLMGWNPFISPMPLEAVDGYTLVYETEQTISGVPEVKVFKRER